MSITLTTGMRQNLFALQQTTKLMDLTQTRLSTGKRVNTALDDPINFFAAEKHQQRKQRQGKGRLMKRHQVVTEKWVERLVDQRQVGRTGDIEQTVHRQIPGRIQGEGQSSQEDAERIKQAELLHTEK